MKVFVDTWGWLAMANRAEKEHQKIAEYVKNFTGTLYTTDYVLSETVTMLFKREYFEKGRDFVEKIFETAEIGNLEIIYSGKDTFLNAWNSRLKFKDKPNISFVDIVSFVVMKKFMIRRVITEDNHFEQVGMGFELVK